VNVPPASALLTISWCPAAADSRSDLPTVPFLVVQRDVAPTSIIVRHPKSFGARFPFERALEAMRLLQSGKTIGKVVLQVVAS